MLHKSIMLHPINFVFYGSLKNGEPTQEVPILDRNQVNPCDARKKAKILGTEGDE